MAQPGRQAGITAKQVKQAIEALTQQGAKVSNRAIRAELGDTGSLSTIARLRAQVEIRPAAEPDTVQLSDTLTSAISKEVIRISSEKTAELQAHIADIEKENADLIKDGENTEEKHKEQVARLAANLENTNKRLEEERQARAKVEGIAEEQQRAHDLIHKTMEQQRADLQKANEEIKEQAGRIATLEARGSGTPSPDNPVYEGLDGSFLYAVTQALIERAEREPNPEKDKNGKPKWKEKNTDIAKRLGMTEKKDPSYITAVENFLNRRIA